MGELVGSSASYTATWRPFQRNSFYAVGRFWVFYGDGIDSMVYRTSTDGINWSEDPITIRPLTSGQGQFFSIWFDETYLHYACNLAGAGNPILYRRGIPNSDGSITWSAAEQTAVAGAGDAIYGTPCVSVDSEGYPWIGYSRTFRPYVTRSPNNDGTWGVTPGGFPYQLLDPYVTSHRVSVIPLTGREMLAIYTGQQVRAQRWNGATWGAEISTSNAMFNPVRFSAVAQGNDVHLVFSNFSHRLTYAKYDYSSNSFIDEKTIINVLNQSSPVISIDENNNLYVFWDSIYTLYYVRYTAETDAWGPAVNWKSEIKIRRDSLTCFYKQYSGYTGLAYTTLYSDKVSVEIKIVTTETDPWPRFHGKTVDQSLDSSFWTTQFDKVFKTTGSGFTHTQIVELTDGSHYVIYGNSASAGHLWHTKIFINGALIAEGDVDRSNQLRADFTITYPGSYEVKFNYVAPPPPSGSTPEPGEPGSPGAPEPTPEPIVVSNTLISSGSRHTTPEEGSVGTALITKKTRIVRHITWVPVVITKA